MLVHSQMAFPKMEKEQNNSEDGFLQNGIEDTLLHPITYCCRFCDMYRSFFLILKKEKKN